MTAVFQRLAVAASCVVFWLLATERTVPDLKLWLLGLLSLFACVEKLCDIMNTISVERDWVSVHLSYGMLILTVIGCCGCYGWGGGFGRYATAAYIYHTSIDAGQSSMRKCVA